VSCSVARLNFDSEAHCFQIRLTLLVFCFERFPFLVIARRRAIEMSPIREFRCCLVNVLLCLRFHLRLSFVCFVFRSFDCFLHTQSIVCVYSRQSHVTDLRPRFPDFLTRLLANAAKIGVSYVQLFFQNFQILAVLGSNWGSTAGQKTPVLRAVAEHEQTSRTSRPRCGSSGSYRHAIPIPVMSAVDDSLETRAIASNERTT
jgi:hypothetical protein